VWAQEHLYSAGQHLGINGNFGAGTQNAVNRFQAAHGLPSIGSIGPLTWQALLRYPAARVRWTAGGARIAAAGSDPLTLPVPESARLPDKRLEIPRRDSGAGWPSKPR
jgi:peptidoglycan hydrolase-like protein with peptidoglycan-binding domain